jgi:hypothetical protein
LPEQRKKDALGDREKALEDSFFARREADLLERMRGEREQTASREALARISGIDSDEILESLVPLGIGPETWTALSLVPLVEVAWANGRVEAQERRAILVGAEANGILRHSPAWELLENWLAHRPDGRLLEIWGEYIVALCAELDPAEKHGLRDEVLGRARSVASAAGGFLGLGQKISREEEVVLAELAKAFER